MNTLLRALTLTLLVGFVASCSDDAPRPTPNQNNTNNTNNTNNLVDMDVDADTGIDTDTGDDTGEEGHGSRHA